MSYVIEEGLSPTIAQTPMSGSAGTTFVQWGTGFTPDGTATLHFQKPDGTEYPTQSINLDDEGHFEIEYTAPHDKPAGIYTWWAFDDTSGKDSNKVKYKIERAQATGIDHFAIDPISSPQNTGVPFEVRILAKNPEGNNVDCDEQITISSNAGQISPEKSVEMKDGIWQGNVKIFEGGTDVIIRVNNGNKWGESNPFKVNGSFSNLGNIEGYVRDNTQGDLFQARVYLSGVNQSIYTNKNGYFRLESIPSGNYELWAEFGVTQSKKIPVFVPEQRTAGPISLQIPIYEDNIHDENDHPVVLVPGIMGSSLDYFGPDAYAIPRLPDYPADRDKIQLHDPINKPGWRSLIKDLEDSGYRCNDTIFTCPYDWRMPLNEAVDIYLKPCLKEALKKTGKVNVIAHSMGGLLVRAFIQSKDYKNEIDKFAMVGTPNRGAAIAYYLWEGGDPYTADDIKGKDIYSAVTEQLVQKQIIRPAPDPISLFYPKEYPKDQIWWFYNNNVKSLRELLPTNECLKVKSGESKGITSSTNSNDFLKDLNEDPDRKRMGSSIETKCFVGDAISTLKWIHVKTPNTLYRDGVPINNDGNPETPSKGDGTVLVDSAAYPYKSHGGWMEGSPEIKSEVEHFGLIKSFKDELVNFVSGTEATSSKRSLALQNESERSIDESDENLLNITIYGKVQPYLINPNNNKCGVNPENKIIDNSIQDAGIYNNVNFSTIGIVDPSDGSYQISLHGHVDGDYKIDLEYLDGEKYTNKEYQGYYHKDEDTTIIFSVDSRSENPVSVKKMLLPPESLVANPYDSDPSKTRLTWNAPNATSNMSYRIYWRIESEPYFSELGTTENTWLETEHQWVGDESVESHIYAVTAHNQNGEESFFSFLTKNNDRDHDGLTDQHEIEFGTNILLADTDGDTLLDGQEEIYGTSSILLDTDGDGYDDAREIDSGSDPLDRDSVPSQPKAYFSADPTSGNAPLTVSFQDESVGKVLSWLWKFGDGQNSTKRNPTHIYNNSGIFSVSLTVTGTNGTDTMSKKDLIEVHQLLDSDGDGLSDVLEGTMETDPNDADTDDDGIPDGVEDANHNGVVDTGETDPFNLYTDGDGIQDGTEMGLILNDIGPDTDTSVFQPDLDPTTTTDPLDADSDNDGISDGDEDTNHNGRVDENEVNPTQPGIEVPFTINAPVIDGGVGTDEWRKAQKITLPSAQGTVCDFYVMHDQEKVYLGVSAVEDTTNTTPEDTFSSGTFDNMAVWFGQENADVQAGEMGYGYWLYGNGYLRTNRINWRDDQLPSFQSSAQGRVKGPAEASHMSYELMIPKEELTDAIVDNRVQAGIHYWNDYDFGPSFWGPPGVTVYDLESYGLLVFSQYGDLNIDGTVDLLDVILSLQTCAGILSGSEVSLSADVNGDGKIGLADSVYILQNLAEKRQ